MMRRWILPAMCALASVGCGDDANETPPAKPPRPSSCTDDMDLLLPDGRCIRPGVPVDGCAPGFEHDGAYGCNAVLPDEPCPAGQMAVPGDSACRSVMECGSGRWGDIPVDATTQYVDGAYAGGGNDGSEARPYQTINDAIAAAAPGAVIAIAAGTYAEDILLGNQPVRLWGVCPDAVSIVASGQPNANCPASALCIVTGAAGSEVHGVSITGAGRGAMLSDAEQVIFDRVYVHDTDGSGLHTEATLGPVSLTVMDSLIEHTTDIGVFVSATDVELVSSVVVATQTLPGGSTGRGVQAQTRCSNVAGGLSCDPSTRARVRIDGSVIEQNHDFGVRVMGSDLEMVGSVLRTTTPNAAEEDFGFGMEIQMTCDVPVTGPLCHEDGRAHVSVTGSLVEANRDHGIRLSGADVSIDTSIVRATAPNQVSLSAGGGISVTDQCEEPQRQICPVVWPSDLTLGRSLIEQNHAIGLSVVGSTAQIDSVVVRANEPASDGHHGVGILLQFACYDTPNGVRCDPERRATASVSGSLIAGSKEAGISVTTSDLIIDTSVVRDTEARIADGLLGDGLVVVHDDGPASAMLSVTRIDDNARAGLANFGSFVALESMRVNCAAFALAGEPYQGESFTYDDRGDNLCGCPADSDCRAISAGLQPPEPLQSGP